MIAEEAAGQADVKVAEPEGKAAKREEAAANVGQREPRRQEGRRVPSDLSKATPEAELTAVGSDDYMAAFNRACMTATFEASEAMLKATSLITEELTSFACQRLRTDMETGRSLMSPDTDWGQAIDLQGKFAADAVRDYLEELTKMTQLAAQTTPGRLEPPAGTLDAARTWRAGSALLEAGDSLQLAGPAARPA
jgi:hypothetical protein